jgi:hypothetical protein
MDGAAVPLTLSLGKTIEQAKTKVPVAAGTFVLP